MKPTVCTATSASYASSWSMCRCQKVGRRQCKSSYPCLILTVSYEDDDGKERNAQIHDTEEGFTYHKQVGTGAGFT